MSEFKIIESQEQLDSVLKDRLERKEASVRKEYEEKYSDYEELKSRSSSFDAQLEALTKERDDYSNQVKELNSKIKQSEMNTLKQNIAYEMGLPREMASRLNGDDEESLRQDASTLASFVNSKPSPPRKNLEGKPTKDDEYRNLLKGLNLDD